MDLSGEPLARAAGDATARGTDAPVPLWIALLGLAGGAAFAHLASAADQGLEAALYLSGAAAAGGLGAYGLFERGFAVRRAGRCDPDAAFEALCARAPEAAALIDRSGRIRALNHLAEGEARRLNVAKDGLVFDLLPGVAGAENTVYRLLGAAASGDVATERFTLRRNGRAREIEVYVWAAPDGAFVWRWRAAGGAAEGLAFAWFEATPDGRLMSRSPEFDEWFERDEGGEALSAYSTDLARAVARCAEVGGPTTARCALGDGRVALACLARVDRSDSGELLVSGAVSRPDRPEGAAPAGATDQLLRALDGAQSARLFDDAPVGVAMLAPDGRILRWNAAARRLLRAPGAQSPELGTAFAEAFIQVDRDEAVRRLRAAAVGAATGGPAFEARLAWAISPQRDVSEQNGEPDDEGRVAQVFLSRIETEAGDVLLAYIIDKSERKALEQRFLQSQRLQAVGQLAGGIAHDFNNLLTIIIGGAETLLRRAAAEDPGFAELDAIHQSAHRAAHLTSQLLAYSRQQTLLPQIANLTERLSDLGFMLNRLLGEKIALRADLAEGLWDVRIDVQQFERVVTNLVVNARDAIVSAETERGLVESASSLEGEGRRKRRLGRVVLRTRNDDRGPKSTDGFSIPPGEYVRIDVEDDGVGIPQETLEKIFEPFFTTKGVGKGTGLGLSMAYGFVKQSGGYIFVRSEIGRGARFSVFLPRWSGAANADGETLRLPPPASGGAIVESANDAASGASLAGAAHVVAPSWDVLSAAERDVRRGPRSGRSAARRAGLGAERRPQRDDAAAGAPASEPIDPLGGSLKSPPRTSAPRGDATTIGRTIMLVEDEPALRAITANGLRAAGHDVVETITAEEALEALQDSAVEVDLLLSDVVMPDIDGPSLLKALGGARPEMRTLFMSGYPREDFKEKLDALDGARRYGFLQKPFSLDALSRAVAEQFDDR